MLKLSEILQFGSFNPWLVADHIPWTFHLWIVALVGHEIQSEIDIFSTKNRSKLQAFLDTAHFAAWISLHPFVLPGTLIPAWRPDASQVPCASASSHLNMGVCVYCILLLYFFWVKLEKPWCFHYKSMASIGCTWQFTGARSLLYWSMLAACTVGPGTVVTCARAGVEYQLLGRTMKSCEEALRIRVFDRSLAPLG